MSPSLPSPRLSQPKRTSPGRLRGSNPFIMKMMSVLVELHPIIRKDFEAGLAAMKAAAER